MQQLSLFTTPQQLNNKKKRRVIPMLDAVQVIKQLKGRRVEVYFNLHKHVFSLRCAKTKLVLAHCNDWFVLQDVKFKVSEAGRQRVLREKKKNVHAYVQGTIGNLHVEASSSHTVTYNPYRFESFVASPRNTFKPWKPIFDAPAALMIMHDSKPQTIAYDDWR